MYGQWKQHEPIASFFVFDGNRTGLPEQIFTFRCTLVPQIITCTNSVGDSLRYMPTKATSPAPTATSAPFTDPRGVRSCGNGTYVVSSYSCDVARNVEQTYKRSPVTYIAVSSGLLSLPMR